MENFKVKDLALAEFGRKEIDLAQAEMPALMALRSQYAKSQPLAGAKIIGCIHMTVQTAVLIETLIELGAQVQWSSCNRFSTQDHAAAAIAQNNVPVWAWKGQTEEEYEWCIHQSIHRGDAVWDANMLLDDGGDLTEIVLRDYPNLVPAINGVSEETTTGVQRLFQMLEDGNLPFPAINVNDSVTKSKNDNKYGCRHSLTDALKRATDMLLSGKKALVFGYGDVGKGCASGLQAENMIVKVVEVDPICAMQACLDGFEVVSPWIDGDQSGPVDTSLLQSIDVLVTATGCVDVCTLDILKALKNGCVVCNIGHFDNEIAVEQAREAFTWVNVKDMVDQMYRSDDLSDYLLLLAEGRLVNLANATGHPSRVMDGSFANQVLAQKYLWEMKFAQTNDTDKQALITVQTLPRKLDEQVAQLMVDGFGGTVTTISQKQRDYLRIEVDAPMKPELYRY